MQTYLISGKRYGTRRDSSKLVAQFGDVRIETHHVGKKQWLAWAWFGESFPACEARGNTQGEALGKCVMQLFIDVAKFEGGVFPVS